MKQVKSATPRKVTQLEPPIAGARAREAARAAAPGLCTGRALALEPDGRVRVEIGATREAAAIDPSVHRVVVEGAIARGERLLLERDPDGALLVIGALRTQPTPGVDAADEYTIEAKRITLRGEEVSLASDAAAIVLRALGEVETYADRIISRAETVHKIVGRVLRLN